MILMLRGEAGRPVIDPATIDLRLLPGSPAIDQWDGLLSTEGTVYDSGDYTLHVRASNSDGLWNHDGLALSIHVAPAPWLTWCHGRRIDV